MSTKEKTPETDEAEAKGGKKKLLLIVLVVLLAAGGAAYFFLFSGSAKAAAPTPGTVMTLDPVAVNLSGGGYLKVGVALQLTSTADSKTMDGAKAIDLVISTFSQAAPADVTGAREALKKTLEKKIEKAYDGEVMGIYYTDYVTQ
ncbi:MAG TPA: flagellar basal body-associated FliL family protein [Blastococcus sp.]|jgi:flagellar FliL protein|nr:flagellar basal body-associated FliL family protein [Blastococcus sp.]